MFEKYLKLINDSKNKHNQIKDYLKSLNIEDCYIDIIGIEVIIKTNSFDIFIFEENKEKIEIFLISLGLKLKQPY